MIHSDVTRPPDPTCSQPSLRLRPSLPRRRLGPSRLALGPTFGPMTSHGHAVGPPSRTCQCLVPLLSSPCLLLFSPLRAPALASPRTPPPTTAPLSSSRRPHPTHPQPQVRNPFPQTVRRRHTPPRSLRVHVRALTWRTPRPTPPARPTSPPPPRAPSSSRWRAAPAGSGGGRRRAAAGRCSTRLRATHSDRP